MANFGMADGGMRVEHGRNASGMTLADPGLSEFRTLRFRVSGRQGLEFQDLGVKCFIGKVEGLSLPLASAHS